MMKSKMLTLMLLVASTAFAQSALELTQLDEYIVERSQRYQLDSILVSAVVMTESKWKGDAINPDGQCFGLMQLDVKTARWIMKDPSITKRRLLTDYMLNLDAGMRYLAYCIKDMEKLSDKYCSWDLALTAYNRGPGTVRRLIAKGIIPFNSYKDLVYGNYRQKVKKIVYECGPTKDWNATGHWLLRSLELGSEYGALLPVDQHVIRIRKEGVRIRGLEKREQILQARLLSARGEQVRRDKGLVGQRFKDKAQKVFVLSSVRGKKARSDYRSNLYGAWRQVDQDGVSVDRNGLRFQSVGVLHTYRFQVQKHRA